MLKLGFITLFPEMVLGALEHSIIGRAQQRRLIDVETINPRDFTYDKHRTVDDVPYGGDSGMVLKPEPIAYAIEFFLAGLLKEETVAIVLTDPIGLKFEQRHAVELAGYDAVLFLCGRYEGIDDRVRQLYATHVYSIGDFILTGGELPALVMADAACRYVRGVVGSEQSLGQDSHSDGLLSCPQYTRPEEFKGVRVPEVLRSGDHRKIQKWKREQALKLTRQNRPDLFCRADLAKNDSNLLSS